MFKNYKLNPNLVAKKIIKVIVKEVKGKKIHITEFIMIHPQHWATFGPCLHQDFSL